VIGECVFCDRITAGEYDYSDANCVAFEPLLPVTPGHFLVVPRKHVAHTLESPVHAGHALRFAGFLANQMGLDAANFITSAGLAATQSVFHLHIHIVPRRPGDDLVLPWTHQQAELLKLPGAVAADHPDKCR
jgi:histidine triad (HIT) family protein